MKVNCVLGVADLGEDCESRLTFSFPFCGVVGCDCALAIAVEMILCSCAGGAAVGAEIELGFVTGTHTEDEVCDDKPCRKKIFSEETYEEEKCYGVAFEDKQCAEKACEEKRVIEGHMRPEKVMKGT